MTPQGLTIEQHFFIGAALLFALLCSVLWLSYLGFPRKPER